MVGIGDVVKFFGTEKLGEAIVHGGQSALKSVAKDLLSGKSSSTSSSSSGQPDVDTPEEVERESQNQGIKSDSLDPGVQNINEPTLEKADAPAIRIDGDDLVRSLTTFHSNIVGYLKTIDRNNLQAFDYTKRKLAAQDATFVSIKNTVSKFNQSISGLEARLGRLEGDFKNSSEKKKVVRISPMVDDDDDDRRPQSQPAEKESALGGIAKAVTGAVALGAAVEMAPEIATVIGSVALGYAIKKWNEPNSQFRKVILDDVVPLAEAAAKKAAGFLWEKFKSDLKQEWSDFHWNNPFTDPDAIKAQNGPYGVRTLGRKAVGAAKALGNEAVSEVASGTGLKSFPGAAPSGILEDIKQLWNSWGSTPQTPVLKPPVQGGMLPPAAQKLVGGLLGFGNLPFTSGTSFTDRVSQLTGGGNASASFADRFGKWDNKQQDDASSVPDLINNNNFGPPDLARGQTLSPADLIYLMSQITGGRGTDGATKSQLPGFLQMALGSGVRDRYGGGVGSYGTGPGTRGQYGGGVSPYGTGNITPESGAVPSYKDAGNFRTSLTQDRARYAEELENNPQLLNQLMAHSYGENNDPTANLAVIEEMMNRASVRGTSLAAQISYEQGNRMPSGKAADMVRANIQKALGGSNVNNFATDNSSIGLAYTERYGGAMGGYGRPGQPAGKFTFQSEYGGNPARGTGSPGMETFFSPGWAEKDQVIRYQRWRAGLTPDKDADVVPPAASEGANFADRFGTWDKQQASQNAQSRQQNVHGGSYQPTDPRSRPTKPTHYEAVPGSEMASHIGPDGHVNLKPWMMKMPGGDGLQIFYNALSPANKKAFDNGTLNMHDLTTDEYNRLEAVDKDGQLSKNLRPIQGAMFPTLAGLKAIASGIGTVSKTVADWYGNLMLEKHDGKGDRRDEDATVKSAFDTRWPDMGAFGEHDPAFPDASHYGIGGYTGQQSTAALPYLQSRKYWGATGQIRTNAAPVVPSVPYLDGSQKWGTGSPAQLQPQAPKVGDFADYSHPKSDTAWPAAPNPKFYPIGGQKTDKAVAPPFPHQEKQHQYDEARVSNARPKTQIVIPRHDPEQMEDGPGQRGYGQVRDPDRIGICSV